MVLNRKWRFGFWINTLNIPMSINNTKILYIIIVKREQTPNFTVMIITYVKRKYSKVQSYINEFFKRIFTIFKAKISFLKSLITKI